MGEMAGREAKGGSLKFTPLEFETPSLTLNLMRVMALKFTPLEFETKIYRYCISISAFVKIYSVGV